jgi:glucose/arabinose dehydrogenase
MKQSAFLTLFFIIFFTASCQRKKIIIKVDTRDFPAIVFSKFATGFSSPVQITHAGDGSNRLFVLEKNGIVKIISNASVLKKPFLDISKLVSNRTEQGLLGIAFPPNFKNKRYFYVNYTNRIGVGNTVIARYPLTGDLNIANSKSGISILNITQPFTNHNGGQIAFGPDGFLYIGTGDGGGSGDPFGNAQDHDSLLGKILRIDVDSGVSPYLIPKDNPFPNNEVWSSGLRNPWRFSFDRLTNELYIADVGQNHAEEVNVQPSGIHENYGWNIMEGSNCFKNHNCRRYGLVLPVTEYTHDDGDCSITGGYVYRGTQYPKLVGIYLYGDFCSGKIRGLRKNGSRWESKVLLDTSFKISSFGEDEIGNIYFTDFVSGNIYKIEAP